MLGPLLFLIYINDLPSSVSSSTARLFADDCVLYKRITSPSDTKALQQDLDALQAWENKWLMQFHPSKCQVIRVTNKRNPITSTYKIHGVNLETVPAAKYLGLLVDSKLSFKDHIAAITKKANNTRAFLSWNFHRCPPEIKEATYRVYIRPTVEYAATMWDPHTKLNIKKVEQVQRTSARYVTGNRDWQCSVSSMLEDLKWTTLESRRQQARLAMMYRIRFDLVDINWKDYLREAKSRTRGHNSRFLIPHTNTNQYTFSFFPRTSRDVE